MSPAKSRLLSRISRPEQPASATGEASSPEAMYASLVALARDPRRLTSLERLRAALDQLRDSKATEWSVAEVARTVTRLGHSGPKEQSILNDPQYKALVEAYQRAYAPKRVSADDTSHERLLLSIRDEHVMVQVRELLAENRKLQRAVDMLHGNFARLQPIHPEALKALAGGATVPSVVTEAAPPPVSEEEAATLRRFLDNAEAMLESRWDSTGALLTSGGLEVAGYGFRNALERLAASHAPAEPAPSSRTRRLSMGGAD